MDSFTNGVAGVGWPSRALLRKRPNNGVAVIGLRRKPRRSSRRRRCLSSSGSSARSPMRSELVAQRPHGVQAHGLVAGGVADDVGILAVRRAGVVVHGVEQQAGHEVPGRDGPAGVARGRHVVEEHRAQRAVEQVERLETLQILRRQGALTGLQHVRDVDVDAATGAEGEGHAAAPFARMLTASPRASYAARRGLVTRAGRRRGPPVRPPWHPRRRPLGRTVAWARDREDGHIRPRRGKVPFVLSFSMGGIRCTCG